MSCKVQKVLVIQDATKELSSTSIKWVLSGLRLQSHDKVILLGIINPLASSAAATSPTTSCWLLGVKQRLDCSSSLKLKQEFVDQEIAKKKEEYENHVEIREILTLLEIHQIEFQIKVEAGRTMEKIIVKNARNWGATCVILDRQMKQHKKYFMENLACEVLRLKRYNNMERIREPKPPETKSITSEKRRNNRKNLVQKPKKERNENPVTYLAGETSEDKIGSYLLKEFAFSDLKIATNCFSPQNLLCVDGKKIYKGQMPNGVQITIKDHSSNAVKGFKSNGIINKNEFKFEIKGLGKARHENVASLVGYCSENGHRLLVYEFVCNDTLDRYLSEKQELPWDTRVTLAVGAARGLQYLHKNNIYGTNVRPSNILVTRDQKALLTHYGLTRNPNEEPNHMSGHRIKNNSAYAASEYEDSSKTDVMLFGLVLLELITGRRDVQDTNGQTFFQWARPLLKKKMYGELIDPMVRETHDIYQLLWMVRVVEKCLHWDPDKRFSIDKVVTNLTLIEEGGQIQDFSPFESF